MSDDEPERHHHSLHERLDAAEAAADEVVADAGGQLGGEVNALAVPFEELAAAVHAAIHPDELADEQSDTGEPAATPPGETPPAP